jgi:hypothetical protein
VAHLVIALHITPGGSGCTSNNGTAYGTAHTLIPSTGQSAHGGSDASTNKSAVHDGVR